MAGRQVHVAHDEDGRKLAVKVQHAGLREMAAVDTLTIEALVHGVRWLCPDFNYQVRRSAWWNVSVGEGGISRHGAACAACPTLRSCPTYGLSCLPPRVRQWLVDEVKENLPMELDFEHEAANARRCAQNLASPRSVVGKHVAIPKVLPLLLHVSESSMRHGR